MALTQEVEVSPGLNGTYVRIMQAKHVNGETAAAVEVGVYKDQDHRETEGSQPMAILPGSLEVPFDPASSTPIYQQLYAGLKSTFWPSAVDN